MLEHSVTLPLCVRPCVITGMCAYPCLSQHAESTPLGPWPCARGGSSSPAVRSRALTWSVPLAHFERLTCRAQRSAWPTFPWRSFLLSCSAPQQGGQRGRRCLRLHCCPGVLNHRHLLGDTFLCVCWVFVLFFSFFLRCVGGIPHAWTHTQTQVCTEVGYEVLCGGCR